MQRIFVCVAILGAVLAVRSVAGARAAGARRALSAGRQVVLAGEQAEVAVRARPVLDPVAPVVAPAAAVRGPAPRPPAVRAVPRGARGHGTLRPTRLPRSGPRASRPPPAIA